MMIESLKRFLSKCSTIIFLLRLFCKISCCRIDKNAIGSEKCHGAEIAGKSLPYYYKQRHYFYISHCHKDTTKWQLCRLLNKSLRLPIYYNFLYLLIGNRCGRYLLSYHNFLLQHRLQHIKGVKIQKKYIITLTDAPKSLAGAKRCIASAKRYGEERGLEIFPAIKKSESLEFFLRNNLTYSEFADPDIDRDPRAEMGCFASHYLLWQKCIDLGEPILILEHDVEFRASLLPLRFKEVINLGRPYFKWQENVLAAMPNKYREIYCPFTYLAGAYAYAITPEAANKLVNDSRNLVVIPVDEFIRVGSFDIIYYHPQPIVTRDDFSAISKISDIYSDHTP